MPSRRWIRNPELLKADTYVKVRRIRQPGQVIPERPWVGRVIESGPPAYRQLWVVAEDGTEVAPGLLEFQ